jgi:thiamine kinase-like enzyme
MSPELKPTAYSQPPRLFARHFEKSKTFTSKDVKLPNREFRAADLFSLTKAMNKACSHGTECIVFDAYTSKLWVRVCAEILADVGTIWGSMDEKIQTDVSEQHARNVVVDYLNWLITVFKTTKEFPTDELLKKTRQVLRLRPRHSRNARAIRVGGLRAVAQAGVEDQRTKSLPGEKLSPFTARA